MTQQRCQRRHQRTTVLSGNQISLEMYNCVTVKDNYVMCKGNSWLFLNVVKYKIVLF